MEGMHHVGLVVSDLEKSIDFYSSNLGFRLSKQWVNPRNGAHIALVQKNGLTYELIQYEQNPYEGQGAYNHVAILVEDVDKKRTELKNKGIKLLTDSPRIIMNGDAKIIFCYGPDGEMIELHQRLKPKTEEET